jgi:hypothetical protein
MVQVNISELLFRLLFRENEILVLELERGLIS